MSAGNDGCRCARRAPSVVDVEPLDRLLEMEVDAHLADRVGDERAHVEVERRHRLGAAPRPRPYASPDQRFGELEPDVARADDDRPPRLALVDGRRRVDAFGEGLHPEDAVGVDPRDVGRSGVAPVAEHELVEGLVVSTPSASERAA